ncbi:MAG: Chemotaxis protein CheW [Candidatus Heimdallarchaeota archaeon LC_2]|nr:MAG: Chemotaxis protein CheW [Candidatus Heimdallarchaeota archaeon LC_2]
MAVTTQQDKKFVAFKLGNEFYAIDVQQVQEVFIPSSITAIPQAGQHVAGVINYRGTILTVIDLKQRLLVSGTASSSDDEDDIERLYTLIIKSGDTTVGVLVDYVESVVGISDENIKATLDLISSKVQSTFLSGVAKTELGLTILLSINKILSEYDIKEAEKLAQMHLDTKKILGEDEELVITSESLTDFSNDDLSHTDGAVESLFKKVDVSSDVGKSPLDLDALTKAELLKIAIEMEIDDVSARSNKTEIIEKINKKMG